jgi:hypothetical protein
VKSIVTFDRWNSFEEVSWSYQVFSKYDDQLGKMLTANINAKKYCYGSLKNSGSKWTDQAQTALGTGDRFLSAFKDLKHWSDTYNDFQNWTSLNAVLATAANLETYLVGAITTSLQSNPGILFGATKSLDGAKLLKIGAAGVATDSYVVSCTKGEWVSRISSIERIFGPTSATLKGKIPILDKIRIIRNSVGHAFGREIKAAQYHGLREVQSMARVSLEQAFSYTTICRDVARDIDRLLLRESIGDFEMIRFLHAHHKDMVSAPIGERMMKLKKAIGKHAQPRGKTYLKGLLEYWDQL